MIQNRRLQPELMDQPDLDPALHVQALRGLQRINVISRSAAILWPPLAALANETTKPLRVLDIACGGGDNAVAVARLATRAGVSITVDGCDISPCAVEEAQRRATAAQLRNVQFFARDVLTQALPDGYDVIMTSLFLHHLQEQQAVDLLGSMAKAAQRAVLVCDLQRSWLGYGLAWVGCHMLTTSPIVHVDGPRSVEAAFAVDEISKLAVRSGLDGAVITHHWPQRWLLAWRKS
jgi:2-polyprenyl-3-methyl-5-hydroxy-6-metoxy-1,4-benzoquinol methylase